MRKIIFVLLTILSIQSAKAQFYGSGQIDCKETRYASDQKLEFRLNIQYLYRGCTGDQRDFQFDLAESEEIHINYQNGPLLIHGDGGAVNTMYQPTAIRTNVWGNTYGTEYVFDYFEIKSRCNSYVLIEVCRTMSGTIINTTIYGSNLTFQIAPL